MFNNKITRFELISEYGREEIIYSDTLSYELQDDGRTLKVFYKKEK